MLEDLKDIFKMSPLGIIFSNFSDIIGNTLKLYMLHMVMPISVLLMFIITFILGVETKISYFDFLKGFYYDGNMVGIEAWRYHLVALFLISLFVISNKFGER